MDTAAIVLSFLGGSAVGTILTAVYTTSQDRTERFRERMLETAEAFLKSVEAAEESLETLRHASNRVRTAFAAAESANEGAPDSIRLPGELRAVTQSTMGLYEELGSQRAREAFESSVVHAEQALAKLEADDAATAHVRAIGRSTIELGHQARRMTEAFDVGYRRTSELANMLSRSGSYLRKVILMIRPLLLPSGSLRP